MTAQIHPKKSNFRIKTFPALLGLTFVAVAFLFFFPAFSHIIETWGQEEYSHGYLILPIAILMMLHLLRDANPDPMGQWLGLLCILFACALQALFVIANVRGLQPQTLLALIGGFFMLCYGWRATWFCLPALIFLFFATPLPRGLYYALSLEMQMASTSVGVFFIQALGMPVFHEGNIIDLGHHTLQVVEACNGIRYFFPLIAIAFLVCFAYKTNIIKRSIIFFSVLPITIFMNGLRILFIAVTADMRGPNITEGFLHELEGIVAFVGCILILCLEVYVLQKIGRKDPLSLDFLSELPDWKKIPLPIKSKTITAGLITMLALLPIGFFLFKDGTSYVRAIPLKQNLSSFPLQINDWIGRSNNLDSESLSVLGTDQYAIIDYRNPLDELVNLYILYFDKQDGTSNQVVHTPSGCLPAGGWELESQSTIVIPITLEGQVYNVNANRLTATKNTRRILVYFWYLQDDETLTGGAESRLTIIKNALLERRTNGTMIRLFTEVKNGDYSAAEERLKEFMEDGGLSTIRTRVTTQ